MRDLTRLPHGLDAKAATCAAVIETPKGARTKYDFDRKSGLFKLHRLLPEGMSFPTDFGFVPSTLAEDGDPLDIMILADEPSAVGALVEARLIGAIEAEQTEQGRTQRNDRVIAVTAISLLYARIRAIDDLPPAVIDQLGRFWTQKDALEDKHFRVLGVRGPAVACALVKAAARKAAKA